MNWIYKNNLIEDITQFPNNTFGFVYMTTHKPTGKSYIGKKVLFHNQKKKLGKKQGKRLVTTPEELNCEYCKLFCLTYPALPPPIVVVPPELV